MKAICHWDEGIYWFSFRLSFVSPLSPFRQNELKTFSHFLSTFNVRARCLAHKRSLLVRDRISDEILSCAWAKHNWLLLARISIISLLHDSRGAGETTTENKKKIGNTEKLFFPFSFPHASSLCCELRATWLCTFNVEHTVEKKNFNST